MGLVSIDTGMLYRCHALAVLKNNISIKNEKEVEDILEKIGNSGQTTWIEPVIYNVTENLNLKMEYSQVIYLSFTNLI